uniref:Uncharacterized protein n=1 Tax=Heterorhabditis bacteriophora TaxID=37862 RepID=A0A1I7WZA3_HETBA
MIIAPDQPLKSANKIPILVRHTSSKQIQFVDFCKYYFYLRYIILLKHCLIFYLIIFNPLSYHIFIF